MSTNMAQRAQSIIEYVMIFVVVALAITAVYRYVNRSLNGQLALVQEQLAPRN